MAALFASFFLLNALFTIVEIGFRKSIFCLYNVKGQPFFFQTLGRNTMNKRNSSCDEYYTFWPFFSVHFCVFQRRTHWLCSELENKARIQNKYLSIVWRTSEKSYSNKQKVFEAMAANSLSIQHSNVQIFCLEVYQWRKMWKKWRKIIEIFINFSANQLQWDREKFE